MFLNYLITRLNTMTSEGLGVMASAVVSVSQEADSNLVRGWGF